jgi:hypothetical protein
MELSNASGYITHHLSLPEYSYLYSLIDFQFSRYCPQKMGVSKFKRLVSLFEMMLRGLTGKLLQYSRGFKILVTTLVKVTQYFEKGLDSQF